MVSGDSIEGLDSPAGHEDEEEKLLKQAIAPSLEGTAENDNEEEENDEEGAEEEGDQETDGWLNPSSYHVKKCFHEIMSSVKRGSGKC